MTKHVFYTACALTLSLTACQSNPNPTSTPAQNTTQPAPLTVQTTAALPLKHYPALVKSDATGTVSVTGQTLTLTLKLPQLNAASPAQNIADFATQKLDLSTATKLFAQVSDSHGKTYDPVGADGDGAVDYAAGTLSLTFNNVVPDELLFVEVQAKNGTTDISQAELATVLKHTASVSPANTTINFQTTVAAKAMQALLTADATRARTINLNDLETLATSITGVTGTAPALTYNQKHPSLVNTALLATDLQTQLPNTLTAADYRQNVGATVNLTVSGLSGTDKVQVQITDAASAIQTDLGNGSTNITGLTPGSGLSAIVTPFGTPSESYTYNINPTALNLTEGNTTNLTVTATPTMTLTNINPANGPAGTTVTITGTGFTGTTAVAFNGTPAASFTVISDTQITATVPSTATDGTISVTKGGTTKYSTDFDVYRRIYVNDDASGSNNGTSWSDAYTNLQSALAVAAANDEIWVAAGTYKRGANINDSFVIQSNNVAIYGGFSGSESLRSQRNPVNNPVILSGDISGNDNYSSIPFTGLSDNTKTIVSIVNKSNITLDGFTIQGGYNKEGLGAAIFVSSSSNISFNQIHFLYNTANIGASLFLTQSTSVTLGKSLVYKNSAIQNSLGGLSEEAGVYISNNSNIDITNTVFANNHSVDRGAAITLRSSGNTLKMYNTTFANNIAPNLGAFINASGTIAEEKNVLLWQTPTFAYTPAAGNGSFVAGTNPFVDQNNPLGADGIPRTADDGLRIAATATDVINLGVPITGTADPEFDILGLPRVGRPEPGAYEYIPPALPANVILVDKDASGANNGSSWANAYTSLQSALTAATAGKEIWVAEGTYTPAAANGNRNTSFVMKSNVDIYGGFAGGETTRTARAPFTHVVKLSGDLNGNDNYGSDPFTGIAENSYTVVLGASNATLDGVTIEGGNADAAFVSGDPANLPNRVGGGMINNAQSPTLNQVTFTHNTAVSRGGAMFNINLATPVMSQMVFLQNVSDGQGGAIHNINGSPKINVGAFIENKSSSSGGGMYTTTDNGVGGDANPVLQNVIFSGNTGFNGGGMYSGNGSTPELINVTFSNNTGTNDAGAFYDVTSSTTTSLKNVLFWNSTRRSGTGITLVAADGNVDAVSDPFVNASNVAGLDGRYFTADDGLRLSGASAVLNTGTNNAVPDKDILDNDRPGPGNANPEPGAYEYTP